VVSVTRSAEQGNSAMQARLTRPTREQDEQGKREEKKEEEIRGKQRTSRI
jgi:hypothetical protein